MTLFPLPALCLLPLPPSRPAPPPYTTLFRSGLPVASPLPVSANPAQLSVTWPLPAVGVTLPLVGGVRGSTNARTPATARFPAASSSRKYTVFIQSPVFSVFPTLPL